VMIFENLRDYGCEELAFFYDAIYMESKHNTVEEISKKIAVHGFKGSMVQGSPKTRLPSLPAVRQAGVGRV